MAAPHLTDSPTLQDEKRALRRRMGAIRRQCRDDAALIASILSCVEFGSRETIAGIWPLPGEPDLRPLWQALHARGHAILLPETPQHRAALGFRPWHPGCTMLPGPFGTQHPDTDPLPPTAAPDLLFVPLLAFDRLGYRVGYGGGFYDRTLAALPHVRAVGYGFAAQEVETVPRGPFDLPLPLIVTEIGCIRTER